MIFWRELGHRDSALGLFTIFLAASSAPIAALMLQKGPPQSAIATNAVGSLVGIPFALAASFALGETHPIPSSAREALPVVYLAVAGSTGAFVLFAWLLNHWRATTVSFLGVVVPIIAVLLGWIFRHEELAPGTLAGGAIVLIGVTTALRADDAKPPGERLGAAA